MPKFTFKRQPRQTGLAAVARPYPAVDIKLRGDIVGTIAPPISYGSDKAWRARFMVVSDKEHCGWEWVTLKAHFASEQAARDFILENNDKLQASLSLRAMKEDSQ